MKHYCQLIAILLLSLTFTIAGYAQDSLGVTQISIFSNVWGQPGKADYNDSLVFVPTLNTGLRIVDISDIRQPREAGYFVTGGTALWVDVVGTTCYVADGLRGLRIIDVSSPAQPREIGFYDTDHNAKAVVVRDTLAYVADNNGGLRIISVANPAATDEIGFRDTDGGSISIALQGNYVYLSDLGLRVIDISDPWNPIEVAHLQTPGAGKDIAVEGNYAYLADGVLGVKVFDISDPTRPAQLGSYRLATSSVGISVYNQRMYVAAYLGCFRVISALDPAHLQDVGHYLTYGLSYTCQAMGNIALLSDGFSLYLLDCTGAMSAPIEPLGESPVSFALAAPYPNPFNGVASLSYTLQRPGIVTLGIYDPAGNLVMNLTDGLQSAGEHRAVWNTQGRATGPYFARLQTEYGSQTQRVVLVK